MYKYICLAICKVFQYHLWNNYLSWHQAPIAPMACLWPPRAAYGRISTKNQEDYWCLFGIQFFFFFFFLLLLLFLTSLLLMTTDRKFLKKGSVEKSASGQGEVHKVSVLSIFDLAFFL
jgi:hypothetical protein